MGDAIGISLYKQFILMNQSFSGILKLFELLIATHTKISLLPTRL